MEWIDIKEQQPERAHGNKVLGFNGDYVFECEYEDGFWCNIGGEQMTHWMPMPEDQLSVTDTIIKELFSSRWHGYLAVAPVDAMRKQLHKNLTDQINGFWSGSTAYGIMVDGGFLVDSKRERIEGSNMAKGKRLTLLGVRFMQSMNTQYNP